jgi:endonuclease/exonuclease/phosphatase family metal-dependent hydrolase
MQFRDPRSRWQFLPGRRLLFEELERRDLLAVMRVVDWNTLNGPNDATGDANFRTVLQAIGNETVQGNTERVDILALQETDGPGPGGDSIDRVKDVLNTLYSTSSYSVIVSPMDGGGDSTGFVYDTSKVSLLESVQIGAGTLTHNIMRGKFQPVGSPASSIFYVYSIHLKSGDTGADVTTRGTEAAFLRADADSLGEGTQVLFVGDFNMKTSAEAAYQNFVSAGPAQLQDVADAPGDWFDNAAFKSLHSQDPRTTMNDRFDIQFATGEFFDGGGVDYVSNSFHIFGNNGTHTLDQPITTGTGASTDVLNALVAASDHLPAVADYNILASTPSVRVSETLGGTKVVEGGLYDTYQLVLNTVPTANVTVTVTPDAQVDIGNGAGVDKQFTFTPANALTPQTVVVYAVDDAIGEGNHTGLITHSSASADAAYNGLSISSVVVSIIDNDAPAIVINEIDSDTPGTDTMEFVELYDGGVGNFSLNGKTVVFYNGSNDQSYAAFDLTGKTTDANGFFLLGNSGVSPAPGLIFNNNTLQNGADAVALYAAPVSAFPNGTPVTTASLLDAIVYDTSDADDPGLLVLLQAGQPQVNENQTDSTLQSIARVPDGGTQRQTSTYVAQTPTPDTFNQALPFGILVLQSAGGLNVTEGGATDSYQIALESIPTANVLITVDPDNQTDLGAGAGVAIVLTFTPANALVPQTVNVTAVDDIAVEGNHTSTITHALSSADTKYNGLVVPNVIASITDNDAPPPTSIVISELMYDPASDETAPGVGEWIEVVNTGTAATDLSGWLFDDEDATNWGAIPSGTVLSPNQVAVFFDSAFTTAATFRSEWTVPASSLVVGVAWGSLSNNPVGPGDEVLTLLNNVGGQMDVVNYDNASPWPSNNNASSIYLKNLSADNNAGANWARSLAGAPKVVSPTGPTFSTSDIGSPGRFFLPADYNSNASVDAGDFVVWRKTLGSTNNLQADGSGPTVGVPNGIVDQADYTYWRSNFGGVGATSGAGSGAASGDSLAAPAAEPEQSTVASQEFVVDATVINLSPTLPEFSTTSQLTLRTTSTATASATDSLLSILRPATATRPLDDAPATRPESSEDSSDAVDQLFASFDDSDLFAEVGLLSALV